MYATCTVSCKFLLFPLKLSKFLYVAFNLIEKHQVCVFYFVVLCFVFEKYKAKITKCPLTSVVKKKQKLQSTKDT